MISAQATPATSTRLPQMTSFSVFSKVSGTISFESNLTDQQVMDALATLPSQFARDLKAKFHRLSDKQMAWAHKLAVDAIAPAPAPSEAFAPLFAAFEAARSTGAKRMALRFDGVTLKPSRDGASLWVTSQTEVEEGNYGWQPKYLGKITPAGPDARLSADVVQVLRSAAADPLSAAVRHGRETGSCSCCGRELTVKASIEAGIGPVCKEKFGW